MDCIQAGHFHLQQALDGLVPQVGAPPLRQPAQHPGARPGNQGDGYNQKANGQGVVEKGLLVPCQEAVDQLADDMGLDWSKDGFHNG